MQAADNLNTVANLPSGLDHARLEVVIRGLHKHALLKAGINHGVRRDTEAGGQGDGNIDIYKHAGTKLVTGVVGLKANSESVSDRVDIGQDADDGRMQRLVCVRKSNRDRCAGTDGLRVAAIDFGLDPYLAQIGDRIESRLALHTHARARYRGSG